MEVSREIVWSIKFIVLVTFMLKITITFTFIIAIHLC